MHKLAYLTLAAASALSPAILAAQTASPPAGISWRDQGSHQYVDLVDRAPPPPIAVDRGDDDPRIRRFVIRREDDHDGTRGSMRIIVRRDHPDEMSHDRGPHGEHMGSGHEPMDGRHREMDAYDDDEWIDEGRDAFADGFHPDDDGEWDDRAYDEAPGEPVDGYAQGPCCSGGMITETITTTTTYPPTVEERVAHHEVRSYAPVRMDKRRLRRR